jgi:spore germination protein GerM
MCAADRNNGTHPLTRWAVLLMLAVLAAACGSPDPTSTVPSQGLPSPVPCAEAAEPPEADVHAFFHCAGAELEEPRPVARPAAADDATARLDAALRGLLAGPTAAERSAGYISLFSEQTALALLSVEIGPDGLAVVDFADLRVVLNNASTSTGSQILLAQLEATVFQVPEVTGVEYRIHGSCATFWEWLQRACEVVARP